MKTRSHWIALVWLGLLCLAVSALGGAVTATSVTTWFVTLNKPAWNPPNWLFGPVWTVLYAMMAYVSWRLWCQREATPATRPVLIAYFIQLALNCLWSLLFFGLHSPALAMIDIGLLLVVIVWINLRLLRIAHPLALFWLPYVLWVSFASALNFFIWRHN